MTTTDHHTLLRFLNFPLSGTQEVFDLFAALHGAQVVGAGRERVLYIEGSRPVEAGRCLLVAHADTVWDESWVEAGYVDDTPDGGYPSLIENDGVIRSGAVDRGIGADDRAGLAMLWRLKDLGHSLLITDLEEHGRLGSLTLRDQHPERLADINRDHAFAIQLDRRGAHDFKCYDVGSEPFREYLCRTTGYTEPNRTSFTDICTLCDPIGGVPAMCGVNLSIGYYDEHTPHEYLVIAEWQHTLDLLRGWLSSPALPSFRR